MNALPNLTLLANDLGSDKGNTVFHAHHYTMLYEFLFERWRGEAFSMLEIGLQRGPGDLDPSILPSRPVTDIPSAKMWLSYFPRAHVYGLDISDFSSFVLDRFTFIRGDMGSISHLEMIAKSLPPLRLIVDDASHAAYHQQLAFAKLFRMVESGGFYVIEDLHADHPISSHLPACKKTVEVVTGFLSTGNLDIPFISDHERSYAARNISNAFIHRNDRGGVSNWTMKLVAFQKK
jgi:hypothetical protein